MRNAILALGSWVLLTALAEGIIRFQIRLDPLRLAAALAAITLLLAVFVSFTQSSFTKLLRHVALQSAWLALVVPLLLLIPYLIFALGTATFSWRALGKFAAFLLVPTALVLPDRLRHAENVGWRDLAAMLALGFPVSAHWWGGIWMWPQDLYALQTLSSVCNGVYAFAVVRNLEGIGYRLTLRKGDLVDGLVNFVGLALLAIPLGIVLGFLHPHTNRVALSSFGTQFFGIYLTVAIPEEVLFRGILQNILAKTIQRGPPGLYGLLIASAVFGASHLHHPPVPNWKYGILATLAGLFYGNVYRTRHRLSASALTHSLIDASWHLWF